MKYRGYHTSVNYDEGDAILFGRILGINDVIGFHADNVPDLRAAFQGAVDDYLETCAKIGKAPEKAYSGHVMFRIEPGTHAQAVNAAALCGQSLNEFGEVALKEKAETILAG